MFSLSISLEFATATYLLKRLSSLTLKLLFRLSPLSSRVEFVFWQYVASSLASVVTTLVASCELWRLLLAFLDVRLSFESLAPGLPIGDTRPVLWRDSFLPKGLPFDVALYCFYACSYAWPLSMVGALVRPPISKFLCCKSSFFGEVDIGAKRRISSLSGLCCKLEGRTSGTSRPDLSVSIGCVGATGYST